MNGRKISQAGEPRGAALQGQSSAPHRILVVDDDSSIRQLNAELLMRSGYEVDAAEDGAAAWDALSAENYDLLITDHNMPKVTGVELLKKLRAARKALPVIMATGVLPAHEFTQQPWLQPTATLLKPYTAEALLGTVREVLRATDGAPEQSAPPPIRQRLPSENCLEL